MAIVTTLEISDNEDGSGVIAVVSGGSLGALNTLFYQAVPGDLGSEEWVEAGSISGNGPIPVTVETGYYWWKLVVEEGSDTDVANLVYQNATDNEDATHQRIIDAVEARIGGLTLEGIESIQQHKVPDEVRGNMTLPAVIITAYGRAEVVAPVTNAMDEIGYGVVVFLLYRDPGAEATQPNQLKVREAIINAFRSQRLPGVDEVMHCTIEPDPVFTLEATEGNFLSSAFTMRFVAHQTRGI